MLGAHLSCNPLYSAILEAERLGLKTVQFFLRNPRSLRQRFISMSEVNMFNDLIFKGHNPTWVVHAPYALNPCTSDVTEIIKDDLSLAERLAGFGYYVLHPGSQMDLPLDTAVENLVTNLRKAESKHIPICVEFMAGDGSKICSTPEQLEIIADKVKDLNVAFTFDSCHVFAAGYSPAYVYTKYKDLFKVVHINGSKYIFGSRHDQHANLATSQLHVNDNLAVIKEVPDNVPIILETPSDGLEDDIQTIYNYLKTLNC